MKKISILMFALVALASCDKETYRHAVSLVYPASGQYGVMYADQEIDTIVFTTFDSYSATSNVSWITIDPKWASATIANSYWANYQVALPLSFDANTTGETRSGIISINDYGDDDWNQTLSVAYLQLGWLNITSPAPQYGTYTNFPQKATFTMTDSATQVVDTLKFLVYDNWTLQTDADYLHPTITSGSKGMVKVPITIDPNADGQERGATLVLTSRGVSTPIEFKQEAVKE